MDVNQQKGTVAHLRKNYFTKNCELNFSIKTELPGLSLSEEIQIILNKYEKISHLISHIEQELRKLLQTKFDKNVEQIHVAFKSGINNVNNDILLANFPGALVNNNEPVILEVFDQKYMLSFNDPIVKDMKIPPILFANYSVQPVRFLTIFTDRKSCKFTWYKSLDKVEWIECGKGYDYQVQLEDVGHYLKLVCIPSKKDRKDGPMAEAISQFKVQIMEDLPTFPFEKRHEFTKNYSDDRES